jgi:glycylpeptide N-tetradecanoyltransferase
MPVMRYTTSDMAYDMAEILVDVGWIDPEALRPPPSVATPAKFDDPDFEAAATAGTEAAGIAQRRLHIIGISLGGMIAQELGMLIPHAISTLNLCCTAAEVKNTTTFTENMLQRLSLVVPQGLEESVRATALRMFPVDWLMAPDDVHLPDLGREDVPGVGPPSPGPGVLPAWKQGIVPSIDGPKQTGHQDREQDAVPREYRHFPTNYHRYVAQDMAKRLDPARFPAAGFLLQMIAAGWHRKTATELRLLGDTVGRERILVMHGTGDGMLTVPHGETLIALLQPGVGLIVDGMGHGPVVERWKWFNALMADRFAVGERLDGRSEAS